MLFIRLGTGLGSALFANGAVWTMELDHLFYGKRIYEEYVALRGLKKLRKKKWKRHVALDVARLITALHPDDVVLGGGNVKKLKKIGPGLPSKRQQECVLRRLLYAGTRERED
jgi:polyphosphate glucokinase